MEKFFFLSFERFVRSLFQERENSSPKMNFSLSSVGRSQSVSQPVSQSLHCSD